MAVLSNQLAVARLGQGPWHCSMAKEAQSSRISLGGEMNGFRLRFLKGIKVSKASRDLPNAAAEEVKLEEDSIADADKELKKKNPEESAKGLVETWFYGSYKAWPEVHRLLTERNVKSVEWQEAYDLARSGAAILIDVREPEEFSKAYWYSNGIKNEALRCIWSGSAETDSWNIHAQGSFGAALFQLIQGNDLESNLRRFGYALLTDFSGTERNPNFVDQALQAVDGDKQKPVIVICGIGGTLSTFVERTGPKPKKYADPGRRFGRASRSLRAVFELQEAGLENVSYLSGGLSTWIHQGLPTEGGK